MDKKNDEKFEETPDEKSPGDESTLGNLLGEGLKKVLTVGLSAAFLTEESIRNYLGEIKLPKELLNFLIQNAQKSKEQLSQKVSQEIIGLVSKIDFVKEAAKFVETHKFKINAEIEVLKKTSSEDTTSIKSNVKFEKSTKE